MTQSEIARFCEDYSRTPAPIILNWANRKFGKKVAILSSFQSQSLPLLHLVSRVTPSTSILFLDTGFHFKETLDFRDKVVDMLNLKLVVCNPLESDNSKSQELYKNNPAMCCYLNKVEPLRRALQNFDAWVTGIRRDQTSLRRSADLLSREEDGLLKICPMLSWTGGLVEAYRDKYRLPKHPLHEQGYRSVGCLPCTSPAVDGLSERSGRWKGMEKTECGIHFDDSGNLIREEK